MSITIFTALAAFCFLLICLRRPHWALAIVFACSPFPYDLGVGGGVKVSLGELFTVLWAGVFLIQPARFKLGPVWPLASLYLLISVASGYLVGRDAGLTAVFQMVVYMYGAVMVGASANLSAKDVRSALHALLAAGVFLSIIAITTRQFYFLGLHKNAIGAALAAAMLTAFLFWLDEPAGVRRRVYLIASLVCLGGSLIIASRGAWLGALVAILVVLVWRRRLLVVFRMLLIGAVGIPLLWTLLPEDRKTYAMDFRSDTYNISARYDSIEFAKQRFEASPVMGTGVGLRKEYDATNLAMTVLAETGVVGFLAFGATLVGAVATFFRSLRRCRQHAEMQSVVLVLFSLFIAKLAHGMVDHYWSRGVLLLGWLGIGIAWNFGRQARADNLSREHFGEEDLDAGRTYNIPSVGA